MTAEIVIAVGVSWLILASGTIVPLLEALVTTDLAPGWLQALVLAVLSTAAGIITTAIKANGSLPLQQSLEQIAMIVVVALAAHYGLVVSGAGPAITRLTPRFGLGPKPKAPIPAGVDAVVEIRGYGRLVGPPDAVARVRVVRDRTGVPRLRGRAYRSWLAEHVAALEDELHRRTDTPVAHLPDSAVGTDSLVRRPGVSVRPPPPTEPV